MKVKVRYENGVLVPERRLFPRQSTLTIEVADEDLESDAVIAEPAPAPKIEWTESERETFKLFPGLRKAWEILREPVRPEEMAGELSPKEAERWKAINFDREDR